MITALGVQHKSRDHSIIDSRGKRPSLERVAMSDIAHALFSLGDWKAKAGKWERPDPRLGNLLMLKWGRGPASIQRSGRKLPALRYQPYCLENPIRRQRLFSERLKRRRLRVSHRRACRIHDHGQKRVISLDSDHIDHSLFPEPVYSSLIGCVR